MKTIVLVGIVAFLAGYTVVDASKRLIKGQEFATVHFGDEMITVYKVPDGDTTCYVTRRDNTSAHNISCVK